MKYICATLFCFLLAVSASAEMPSIAELEARLEDEPNNEVALYNLGLQLYLANEPQKAISPWSRLKELAPYDWEVQKKLIQAYSACGASHKIERERAIAELYELRESEEAPELTNASFYIRDQFDFEDCRVYVFEYFDMEADWHFGPLLWKFKVTRDGETIEPLVTVGSYESTTQMAITEGHIEEDERIYHLDEYLADGAHRTHGFFKNKPDYDKIKASILLILEEELEPISSFDPNTNTITVDPPEE